MQDTSLSTPLKNTSIPLHSKTLTILGLMSGTSLDGLDLALCRFSDHQHYHLLAATTIPYPTAWRQRLAMLHTASAVEYVAADADLGHWMGQQIRTFLSSHSLKADYIASHGHTVFHQPRKNFTAQIGDPNAICAETGIPVVADFRRLDVALGGQGAPLVPIGDRLLFGNYDCCINLGGIANISFEDDTHPIAFDISPCNMLLNLLAGRLNLPYDADGCLARSGKLDATLLAQMEALDYYQHKPPKTLGKEWFEAHMLPLLHSTAEPRHLLRTATQHIALRCANAIPPHSHSALVTGGGAHNRYLIELLQSLRPHVTITIPDPDTVDYKEAIIFALLGYLRLEGKANCLSSVTGAKHDNCGGALYQYK